MLVSDAQLGRDFEAGLSAKEVARKHNLRFFAARSKLIKLGYKIPKVSIDVDVLRQLALDGKSAAEIATFFGVYRGTILTAMRKHGVKYKRKRLFSDEELIAWCYNGLSASQISKLVAKRVGDNKNRYGLVRDYLFRLKLLSPPKLNLNRRRKIDLDVFKRLLLEGKSNMELAEFFGVNVARVYVLKREHGLKGNRPKTLFTDAELVDWVGVQKLTFAEVNELVAERNGDAVDRRVSISRRAGILGLVSPYHRT